MKSKFGTITFKGIECKNMVTISTPGDLQWADRNEVTLAPGLVIPDQSIGSVSCSIGHDNNDYHFHGILGLGPVSITKGSLRPNKNGLIPTVMNNLKLQGLKEVFSVYIPPITSATGEYSMSCCWLLSFWCV